MSQLNHLFKQSNISKSFTDGTTHSTHPFSALKLMDVPDLINIISFTGFCGLNRMLVLCISTGSSKEAPICPEKD